MAIAEPCPETLAVDPTPLVLRHDREGVATLTLNRPQSRNALSAAMMGELAELFAAIEADPTIRVVVLAANGPAFCAGHDLKEIRGLGGQAAYLALFEQCSALMMRIVRQRQPVIAAVHAMATAAGCQLVASCDLAVASEEAKFATPGVNIGLFCSTPMVALSRAVGRKPAMEMLLTGEPITADQARQFGLINRVTPPETLAAETLNLAMRVAEKSTATVRIGKQAFYRQAELDLQDAYAYASQVMAQNMMTADASEGIDAFVEKRQPHWQDR